MDQPATIHGDAKPFNIADYQDTRVVQELLHSARTIAVVGLSPNVLRASHFVGYYLQRHGYRIIPVNPREKTILGETSYGSLLDIPVPVDIVDVFRAPDAVPAIAREAVQIGAKAIWMQLGIRHDEAAAKATAAGLLVVQDRCIKVEHHILQARGLLTP